MPWGRWDDSFYDHPKVTAVLDDRDGLACVGLYALLMSWSNRHLTDGRFLLGNARRMGGSPAHVATLVRHRLVDERDGAFHIHDFLEYNDSREMVEARRAAERARQREYRRRGGVTAGHGEDGRWVSRTLSHRDNGVDSHRDTHPESHRESPATRPVPSRTRPIDGRTTPSGFSDVRADKTMGDAR